jgi:hypothetical protein
MEQPGGFSTVVDCVVYVSSVANPNKHSRKIACLENFAAGVRATGHTVAVEWDYRYQPSKLAVILGWATTNTGGRNITLRKQIIAEQNRHGFKTMCIDASCFKYLDDTGTYLRYSLGGPFYDRAEYANANSDSTKWLEIQQRLGIVLKPHRTNLQGYILIGMQRDGGFAMKTLSPMTWLQQKIVDIRKHTRRPIVIRPHPGQYNMQDFAAYSGKDASRNNVRVIDPKDSKLIDDLQQAHAAVFFNSSASVASVLEGIPTYVDDASAVTWQVAHHDVAAIESPQQFARDQWIYNLAAAHWSDNDGLAGRIYQKFIPYL